MTLQGKDSGFQSFLVISAYKSYLDQDLFKNCKRFVHIFFKTHFDFNVFIDDYL